MDLTNAERDLIELIRLEDAKEFRLVIMHDSNDEWRVETQDLDSGVRGVGSGNNFQDAWDDQTGLDVRPRKDFHIREP